jgi:hypothetical protein
MMFKIAAFYRFVALPDAAAVRPEPETLREELQAAFNDDELCGTLPNAWGWSGRR